MNAEIDSKDADIYDTSELVLWSFVENESIVYVATKKCDQYGDTDTQNPKATNDGIFYKHDDWKTASTMKGALKAYAASFWSEGFESSDDLFASSCYEITARIILSEGIIAAESFLKSMDYSEIDTIETIASVLKDRWEAMKN